MKSLVLLLALLCYACSTQDADRPFYKWVRERCEKEQPCKIRMSDYNDRAWDKVYVFEPQVMEHEIKEVLGASVWTSGDYAYQIIFIKDGKVVDKFESPIIVDDYESKGSIFFPEPPPKAIHNAYDPDTVFDVRKEGNRYYLSCDNCPTVTESKIPSP
jgi:hypothetical protein